MKERNMKKPERGFTLIELMIVVSIVAILLIIAVPAYTNFLDKARARTAGADLMALSTDLENFFQRNLVYPALSTSTTAQTQAASIGWAASMDDFFVYTAVSDPNAPLSDPNNPTYTLTATGSGAMSGCSLTLTSSNQRTVTSPCDISSW